MKRKWGFSILLAVTFGMLMLLLAFCLVWFQNRALGERFDLYAENRIESEVEELRASLAQTRRDNDGWLPSAIMMIARSAAVDGIGLVVEDADGTRVWPLTDGDGIPGPGMQGSGMGMMRESGMARMNPGMASAFMSVFEPGDADAAHDIFTDGVLVGRMYVKLPEQAVTPADRRFMASVTFRSIWIGIGFLLLFLLIAGFFSSRVGRTMSGLAEAARRIGEGDYGRRVNAEHLPVREFELLENSMNAMSTALHDQRRMRDVAISAIAHDLRTPLTILTSQLEAVRDGVWEMDARRLSVCLEETTRLGERIRSLEQAARMEGEIRMRPKTSEDLTDTVRQSIPGWRDAASRKGIELVLDLGNAHVAHDPAGMRQIIDNLLSNAVRHTERGGCITVRLQETADEPRNVLLTVEDTGEGIAAEHLPNLFERYYRADPARGTDTGGSGLGLSIVRMVAEAHEGRVSVTSAVGRGTRFEVQLPVESLKTGGERA